MRMQLSKTCLVCMCMPVPPPELGSAFQTSSPRGPISTDTWPWCHAHGAPCPMHANHSHACAYAHVHTWPGIHGAHPYICRRRTCTRTHQTHTHTLTNTLTYSHTQAGHTHAYARAFHLLTHTTQRAHTCTVGEATDIHTVLGKWKMVVGFCTV